MRSGSTLIAALAGAGLVTGVMLLDRQFGPEVRPVIVDQLHGLIAGAGQWITNPDDGSRICRLRSPLSWAMSFSRDLCEDWQIPMPAYGQTVNWIRWAPGKGSQINIEGRWRP